MRKAGGAATSTHLFLKALLTMALSTRRSPTCDGPRKWNISMARSVGWAWHSRLQGRCHPMRCPHHSQSQGTLVGCVPALPKHHHARWTANPRCHPQRLHAGPCHPTISRRPPPHSCGPAPPPRCPLPCRHLAAMVATFSIQAMICPPKVLPWWLACGGSTSSTLSTRVFSAGTTTLPSLVSISAGQHGAQCHGHPHARPHSSLADMRYRCYWCCGSGGP